MDVREHEDPTDPFFMDAVEELERRRQLERVGRIAAEITVDLESKGPLGLYAVDRRNDAAAALRTLAAVDPRDAVAIAEAQAVVREYLRVFEWVGGWADRAVEAEEIINREYNSEQDDTD